MATPSPHAAIIGTSVSGLAAALALGLRGYSVTCIERDSSPMPRDHLDAFAKWDRRGAAQTRHSHVLLAPLVKLLKANAADFYQQLLAAGAEELGFAELVRNSFGNAPLEPGDEDITFLACRRVVFEFLLRRYIAQRHGVRIIEGATVDRTARAAGRAAACHRRSLPARIGHRGAGRRHRHRCQRPPRRERCVAKRNRRAGACAGNVALRHLLYVALLSAARWRRLPRDRRPQVDRRRCTRRRPRLPQGRSVSR